MTVVFDTYIPGTSLLHRLDPRVKLWLTLLGIATVFLLPDLLTMIWFVVAVQLLLFFSGISGRVLRRVWRQMAVLLVLIVLLQPFFRPSGRAICGIGPFHLTLGGIQDALRLAARALGIAFVTAGLLFTTEHPVLIRALVQMGLPYTWGLTISLALRFLPATQDLFHAIRDAQRARGWLPAGGPIRRLKEYIPVLVAVMIGTLRLSDQLTLALAARGFDTMQRRTVWHELHMQGRDWAWAVVCTVGFGVFAWWRLKGL